MVSLVKFRSDGVDASVVDVALCQLLRYLHKISSQNLAVLKNKHEKKNLERMSSTVVELEVCAIGI